MASLFSLLSKTKKSETTTEKKEPQQISKTSNEGVKKELRALNFEEGENALKPKSGLLDKGKATLGQLEELHDGKSGSKKSGDKLQGLMSSSHAKRAQQCVKTLGLGVANNNTFHALTTQLMGGDMDKLAEAYRALAENDESLAAGVERVFGSKKYMHGYLSSILERGEPDLRSRLWLATGHVTGAKASQSELMKLVEGAEPSALEELILEPDSKAFFETINQNAKEYLTIFKGKGKRILAAVSAKQAEMDLEEIVGKHGQDSKEASAGLEQVIKLRSEQLCEAYHQRWSKLKGLSRSGMASDIERICKHWDKNLRNAVVEPGMPFWNLLVKEQKSYNTLISTGAGKAGYLLNLITGEAKSSDVWFPEEQKKDKKVDEKKDEKVDEKKDEKKSEKSLGPKSDTPIGKSKKLEFEKTEGESEDHEIEVVDVADHKAPNTELVGAGPMEILRELERKKSSKKGIKHLKGGYFMKWKTLEEKVSALDDTQRLELLVSFLSETEQLAMFDPEADAKAIDATRTLAIERLRDQMLEPAGMSGNALERFMGAFRRGASNEGHREDSAYGRLRALAASKLYYFDFGARAAGYVNDLKGGELFEVANDKTLLATLKRRCGTDDRAWPEICLLLNLGDEGASDTGKTEDTEGRKEDLVKREDLGLSGEDARQHAADMAELRPEFWAIKLSKTIIGGLGSGQRHEVVMLLNGALQAGQRRYKLTAGKDQKAPKGLVPMGMRAFTKAVLDATSSGSMEDLRKDDMTGPAIATFEKAQFVSAVDQIRVGLIDNPYEKGDDLFMMGKTSRLVELVNLAKGDHLLHQWSNYPEWLVLKDRLDAAKEKKDDDNQLEVQALEDKLASYTIDVNADVQDATRGTMTTSRRVQFLDVVRNRLADAMQNDAEFRDHAESAFDIGSFSQERTRSLGALDGQQLEDSTAQWSMISGSHVRKESRDMLTGRVRTGYETLRSGKSEGKEDEAKEQVDGEQSKKIAETRTELKQRTQDFAAVRDTANTITMAVVGAVVGAVMTAIATGVSVATFGGAAPIWAAMLFAAGAAVGTAAVNLTLEAALKGDKFNAAESVSKAAMSVLVAGASGGAAGLGQLVGTSLGLSGMTDLGSLVAMAAIKSAIRSAARRGLQIPLQVAKNGGEQLPGYMLGQLAGFMGDLAGGVAASAVSGGIKESAGFGKLGEGDDAIEGLIGKDLKVLQSGGKIGAATLGTIVNQIPMRAVAGGTVATKVIYQELVKLSDSSVGETDSELDGKQDKKSHDVVGWRTAVRLTAFAADKKAGRAQQLAKQKKGHEGADALAEKAEALSLVAGAMRDAAPGIDDVKALGKLLELLTKAVSELDEASAIVEKETLSESETVELEHEAEESKKVEVIA